MVLAGGIELTLLALYFISKSYSFNGFKPQFAFEMDFQAVTEKS
jgi:hypothetical protein